MLWWNYLEVGVLSEREREVSVMKFLHTTHIPLTTGMWVECRPWNQSMGLNRKNSWHCFIFFYFGTEHRTPFGDNVVTTSGPKGFFLNFNIGIVPEILPGWQNFKSPVEMYHGHWKFCRIGRILKVLGYDFRTLWQDGVDAASAFWNHTPRDLQSHPLDSHSF